MLEIILDQFNQGSITLQTACTMIEAYHREKFSAVKSPYENIWGSGKTVPLKTHTTTSQFDSAPDFYKDH